MKRGFLLLVITSLAFKVLANNILVTDPSLTGQIVANHTVQVEFKILWNNSWRTSTAVPLNWDAAWVFVKYKVDGDKITRERFCPRCGPGVFLMNAKERVYRGKCHYSEFGGKPAEKAEEKKEEKKE